MKKLLLGVVLATVPGWAGIIGSSVTGVLNFGGSPTNYWDPANSFVPVSGYDNSGGCTTPDCTVVISGVQPTFGFQDSSNLDVASFENGTDLIISDTSATGGSTFFTMTFTDPQFTGATDISDNFPDGGLTVTFSGDTITASFAGGDFSSATADISLSSASATAPEPTSVLLVGGGLLLAGFLKRRLF